MSKSHGFDAVTGAWNDSLTGDFLWSRNNFGEARPDVMSPFTYSLSEKVWSDVSFLPGYHLSGNICGRYYANVSVSVSMLSALGRSMEAATEQMRGLLGNVPQSLEIPTVALPRSTMFLALPRMIRLGLKEKLGGRKVPAFLATNPDRCRALRRRIQQTQDKAGLIAFWHKEILPELASALWIMGGAAQPLEATMKLKAALTDLVDDIFLLTIDEVLDLLTGHDAATAYIPTRSETYARYRELPSYPMIIRGPFDPFQWAADPQRRNDIYDATAVPPISTSNTISGFAGAAGRVEGRVCVLDSPEQGDQLQPGAILVAVTTNVGWTPLFPRAAAVVTDVGAPLSHAAIVARELGIPAVVGCGDATTRLRSGDRVRVDGGRGTVEILRNGHREGA